MSDKFIVRCYAERKDGLWIAVCPQFTLAAQGESFEEAKDHLGEQIKSYVVEAMTVDSAHARELLNRKAPLSLRWRYSLARLRSSVRFGLSSPAKTFDFPDFPGYGAAA